MAVELTGRAAPRPRAPRRPAAQRPRRRLRLLGRIAAAAGLLLLVAIAWGLVAANARFPDSPELRAVSLALPRSAPPSAPLEQLLRGPRLDAAASPVLSSARDAIAAGRWPERPAEVRAALDALRPSLDEVRQALLAPGCLPAVAIEDLAPERGRGLSYLGLLHGARHAAIESVILAQQGEPDRAASTLERWLARYAELERCAPNLLAAMVLSAAITALHEAVAPLLASPRLAPQQAAALLARGAALAQRPSPLPAALRAEAAFRRRTIVDAMGAGAAADARAPRAWPWYDEAQTIALSDQLGRREVWLAQQPASSSAWSALSAEEAYFERLRGQPSVLGLLRYNSVGKTLIGLSAAAYRPQIARWLQARCALAAQQARWIADLAARGRPAAVARPRPCPRLPALAGAASAARPLPPPP